MTHDKAREFFSAHHEGVLEPGLRASLDRSLREDASLQREYDAFVATVESLGALRFEAIESPIYLSDRIATRLENARDKKRAPFWAAWLAPRAGYALGLATALLVAAVGLRNLKATDTKQASFVSGPVDPTKWTQGPDGLTVAFDGAAAHTTTVTPEGGDPQDFVLGDGQKLELALRNPNRLAKRFRIAQGSDVLATVALPGPRLVARRTGSGTVSELASALADTYHVAVVVKGAALGSTVRWNLEGGDARVAAEKSLGAPGSATMMENGILQIGQ